MNTRVSAQTKPKPTSAPLVRSNFLQRKCACGGTPGPTGECEECRKKRVQRKVAELSTLNSQHFVVPPIVHEVLRSPGKPLDEATRSCMGSGFGHDFSHVRLHTDKQAAESARSVDALAYTVGRDVIFGEGQYQPHTTAGGRLLAHELTHTVQQEKAGNFQAKLAPINFNDDAAEREADAVATSVTHGQSARVSLERVSGVARQAAAESGTADAADSVATEPTANAGALTAENEALRQCEANNLPHVKVFPLRLTRIGAAPIEAWREGDDIVVWQPNYVFDNDDFRPQTQTLPDKTMGSGVPLSPDEAVRVHVYQPPWYLPNITGSTRGDSEYEFCVTAEQMLQVAQACSTATLVNIGLTAFEGATVFVPVGRVMQPFVGTGRTVLASFMIGTAEAVPAITGAELNIAVTVVEEQITTEVVGQTLNRTVAQTLVQTAKVGAAQSAPEAVAATVPALTTSGGSSIASRAVLSAGAEAGGAEILDDLIQGIGISEGPSTARLLQAREALKAGTAQSEDYMVLLQEAIDAARNRITAEAVVKRGKSAPYSEIMHNACGIGRDCSAAVLRSLVGETAAPVVSPYQSAEVFGFNRHAFSIVTFPDGTKFLVDTTFLQFLKSPVRKITIREFLSGLEGGNNLAESLLKDGFILLDERTASLYVKSMAAAVGRDQLIPEETYLLLGKKLLSGEGAAAGLGEEGVLAPEGADWSGAELLKQAEVYREELQKMGGQDKLVKQMEWLSNHLERYSPDEP
jgi:hypothetical protein